ncbi:hypothetical protein PIIN_11289 [Serendipita indica DSM 11827]|uniref:Uncharacterized protein n=1 Tax=Serendipita indica (strain DSM 11827) TaxID=1109443 RepID=G4U169_SERID|nr:hypothetical protein PIIN_11289 [Serendipita indica DSM 11827]
MGPELDLPSFFQMPATSDGNLFAIYVE